jgi:hypothetical protein
LEDKISDANISHLSKVKKSLDKIMDELHLLNLFSGEQWVEWQDTQRDEETTVKSLIYDLGVDSLDEFCAKHDAYVTDQTERFKSLVDKAQAALGGYETAAKVASGAGYSIGGAGFMMSTANIHGIMAFSVGTQGVLGAYLGATCLVGGGLIGVGFGLAACYANYRQQQLDEHANGDGTALDPANGQKIVNNHIIAYKAITKAMYACKVHKGALSKLRTLSKDRLVIE